MMEDKPKGLYADISKSKDYGQYNIGLDIGLLSELKWFYVSIHIVFWSIEFGMRY